VASLLSQFKLGSLQHMNLSNNSVGEEGAMQLAAGIQVCEWGGEALHY
jgi:hypothetical protein